MLNKRELARHRNEVARNYYLPGCAKTLKRPRQAVYMNPSNLEEHEITKCRVCYQLLKHGHKYITEACRVKDDLRIDIVDLDSGFELEIVCKHDGPAVIERYKREGVIIVYTGQDILKQIADVFAHE